MSFKYSDLKATLASLHFPDDEVLKRGPLMQLRKSYEAFVTNTAGAKICVLVPHGLKPRDASNLSEPEMVARRVIVLKDEQGKWARIWPNQSSQTKAEPAPQVALPTAPAPKPEPVPSIDGEIVEE